MRGISEITETNETPHAPRDIPGARFTGGADFNWRDHHPDPKAASQSPAKGDRVVASLLADLALGAILATALGGRPKHLGMEGIHSAIDAQSALLRFWQRLNDHCAEQGLPEADYKTAREAFNGGPTPIGAMTFIGKQWDGLRAVPAEPVKYLGGSRPAYHGEYKIVSPEGTVWHKVKSHGEPIVYKIPEAAITAAEEVRNFRRLEV
jgi:hypothetical protein